MATVGVNLLVCNRGQDSVHLAATEWAVTSLLDSDLQEHDYHAVVVDNGSTCPQTRVFLDALSKDRVTVLYLDENLGIARGRNVAYRALLDMRPDWEFFIEVHNDHLFPPKWVRPLIQTMQRRPRTGIVGPALITSAGFFGSPKLEVQYMSGNYQRERARVGAVGSARRRPEIIRRGLTHPCLKRVAMLDEIGLYDEGFPGKTNLEDTEEAYRAYLADWDVLVCFGAFVYHHYLLSRLQLSDHGGDFIMNKAYMDQKHPEWFPWNVEFSRAMGSLYH